MGYWNHPGMGPWGGPLVGIGFALFLTLVIVTLVLVLRYVSRGGQRRFGPPRPYASAAHILAERFARGEIDEEEYRRRMDALSRSAP